MNNLDEFISRLQNSIYEFDVVLQKTDLGDGEFDIVGYSKKLNKTIVFANASQKDKWPNDNQIYWNLGRIKENKLINLQINANDILRFEEILFAVLHIFFKEKYVIIKNYLKNEEQFIDVSRNVGALYQ